MDTKEFDKGNPLNHLVIDAKLKVGKRIEFGRHDHQLSLASISSEMVAGKPAVNYVYVFLETGNIIVINERFVKCCVVSIENQRTVEGEVRKTKIINIDQKEKGAQDRTLGDTRQNGDRIRRCTKNRNRLGSVRQVGPQPAEKRTGYANRTELE